ncbi:MAG TPA: DUF2254 family protein [Xanthomonadales bacterium]|nr:DUF2254 family protein [Xanthomonadales bacterium]
MQRINVDKLQAIAKDWDAEVCVAALPGTFMFPQRPLAWISKVPEDQAEPALEDVACAFLVGNDRLFDEDPRFGLVVRAEIASRALSPAVNDPGTGIDIIGRFVRLLADWAEPLAEDEEPEVEFDRVYVPALKADDLFDDSFGPIARDGAGTLEIACRLQKALASLSRTAPDQLGAPARAHSLRAFALAEKSLVLEQDIKAVRALAKGLEKD